MLKTEEHIRKELGISTYVAKLILDSTPNLYVLKDINGIYIYVNKACAQFLGKKKEEIIGKNDYDLFPSDEAEKYIIGDKAVMHGGQQQKEEWQVPSPNGLIWLMVRCTKLRPLVKMATNLAPLKNNFRGYGEERALVSYFVFCFLPQMG